MTTFQDKSNRPAEGSINVRSSQLPGSLNVIKRDARRVDFDLSKIRDAILRTFVDVQGPDIASSATVREQVQGYAEQVEKVLRQRIPSGGSISIEEIQDQVELALMRGAHHQVARSYVLYRQARAVARAKDVQDANEQQPQESEEEGSIVQVRHDDGTMRSLDFNMVRQTLRHACEGLPATDAEALFKDVKDNLYNGMSFGEVEQALIITTRPYVESHPEYSKVAARLLLRSLVREACPFLGLPAPEAISPKSMEDMYKTAFPLYVQRGIELELLDPELGDFDLARLAGELNASQDLTFTYLGLQTLYDRYFIHSEELRFELPQIFFMRVAMGLAMREDDRNERAIEFYKLLSSFDYMCSTPTLFNSGTRFPQLSSCYLSTVPDNLDGIFGAIHDNAMLSKWAGGLGNDWTPVRGMGSPIRGTNGISQGVVPFLKVVNDSAVAVNQGGKRKGAVCSYLETWHIDVEEFLELRKNTGDDRRRTHDMHTANWIPDLFMERVLEDANWTLFSPSSCSDLHDLYGNAFKERYLQYEALAEAGKIKLYKKVSAKQLWRKMLHMLFETGHPWITFKDPCNIRSPQQHIGVVHSSNLCTEITLNTNSGDDSEIAVCNLGSINLAAHVHRDGLDKEHLQRTIKTAVRMLDNVIDINYYAVDAAKNSNLKHRPVGLGLMGFQDALYIQRVPYASNRAVEFADESMEVISHMAISASCDLAEERGTYESFQGSLWSQGVLPIDSLNMLCEARATADMIHTEARLDWDSLRQRVRKGIRNSNLMAIAPTATISNIIGVSQSIEPSFQHLYTKSNLSGEFTVLNHHLVECLEEEGMWDPLMQSDIKYHEGGISGIDRIPEKIRELFATSFEISPRWLIQAASRRQKWLDQSQSLNLYMADPDGNKLEQAYLLAWLGGLKTTYYLRTRSATAIESDANRMRANKVSVPTSAPATCNIDDPDCEACQ